MKKSISARFILEATSCISVNILFSIKIKVVGEVK